MLDIRRVLCPVDFSDASRHALDHAVVIASRTAGSSAPSAAIVPS